MPETEWVVIVSIQHFDNYKRVMQEFAKQRDDLSRPAATAYEYRWQHVGDPRGYPCLVKTHFFQGKKTVLSPGVVRVDQKCYHHTVYPRDAKLLLEAALRPYEPDPDARPTPRF